MTQEIVELVRAMGRDDWNEDLVTGVCRAVERRLELRLRPGVSPKDCGGAFPIAAAWMALSALEEGGSLDEADSFSAGELTIRAGAGRKSRALEEQAAKLMQPYCLPAGFAVQGALG